MRPATLEMIASDVGTVLHPFRDRNVRNTQALVRFLRSHGIREQYSAARAILDAIAEGEELAPILLDFGITERNAEDVAQYLSDYIEDFVINGNRAKVNFSMISG